MKVQPRKKARLDDAELREVQAAAQKKLEATVSPPRTLEEFYERQNPGAKWSAAVNRREWAKRWAETRLIVSKTPLEETPIESLKIRMRHLNELIDKEANGDPERSAWVQHMREAVEQQIAMVDCQLELWARILEGVSFGEEKVE